MHLNPGKYGQSSASLSKAGRVTYFFAAIMSLALIFGSLLSAFVPGASAAISMADITPFNGDLTGSDCTTYGDNWIFFKMLDDEYPEDSASFEGYYQIDYGDYLPMPQTDSGEGYADFGMYAPCGESEPFYDDGETHTFQFIAYNPISEQYEYSETFEFTLNFPKAPEIIEYQDENYVGDETYFFTQEPIAFYAEAVATNSAVANVSWAIPSLEISGTPDILYDGQLGSDEWISMYVDLTEESLEDGTYTLELYAEDTGGLSTLRHFTLTVDLVPGGQVYMSINELSGGQIEFTEEPMTITGFAEAPGSTITGVILDIPSEEISESINAVDGTFDSEYEDFTITLDDLDLPEGEYDASITGVAADESEETMEFTLIIDLLPPEPPSCGATWSNQVIDWDDPDQSTPNFQSEYTYPNITCTDDFGIDNIQYRVYHNNLGTDIFNPDGNDDNFGTTDDNGYQDYTDFTSGSLGDTSISFDLDIALPGSPNYDGSMEIALKVTDNEGYTKIYRDPFVADYEDQTPPLLSLQLVRPDILTDTTPTITGTCSDNFYVETNTNISSVDVNIDGEGWESVAALDGNYNSRSERFVYTAPELSLGEHEVDVRCEDAAGNVYTTTDDSITFTIEAPSDEDTPEQTEYVESFNDHEFHDFAGSTLIWGNDKLRLREDINVSRTAIDTTNFRDVNSGDTSAGFVIRQGVDENIAWYTKGNEVWRLDRNDNSVTKVDETLGGSQLPFDAVYDVAEVARPGRRLLFIGTSAGLTIFDITNNARYNYSFEGALESMVPDLDRGRFAFYMNFSNDNPGDMKATYFQFTDNANPFLGANLDRIPENHAGMSGTNVIRLFDSPHENEYYISVYNVGLFRFNDNNTPFDFGDDQATQIVSQNPDHGDFDIVFAVTFDPEGKLIFGTSPVENGEVFVLDDDGGTPYDNSDDTIYRLAQTNHLAYNDVFDLTYVEGINGVGDQLFIRMEHNNPVYLNFNSTYDDPLDDTFIELKTNAGIRPSMTKFIVDDYNTLYANIDRQGLFEINLERGWQDSGIAIALPPRPPKTLAINNFLADASLIDPISYIPGSSSSLAATTEDAGWGGFIPQAYAQGVTITYEVSLDDGVTWDEITLGELQTIDLEDYRVQFRITMTPSGGASPVINTYSVAYGAYPNPEELGEVADFEVSVSPTSVDVGENFTINVDAVDVIGFTVPDYDGVVDLALFDTGDVDHTSALSVVQITIVDGQGSATGAFVNRAGTYTIVASNGDGDGESNQFTVTPDDDGGDDGDDGDDNDGGGDSDDDDDDNDDNDNDPALSFSSNDYTVCSNQPFTLRWTSANITSATLNGEGVGTDGTREKTITQTTEFVLYGSGPRGNLTHRLTVTVDPDPVTCLITNPIFTPIEVPLDDNGQPLLDNDGLTVDENNESSGSSSSGGSDVGGPNLDVPSDLIVIEGERVRIWWNAADADGVTVDYLGGTAGVSGSFQFYARESQEIKITAFKNGKRTERIIKIEVKRLPGNLGNILPESLLPPLAASIRYGGFSWLALLGVLKILSFFKRKPDGEIETSWVSDAIKQIQIVLWVISPIMLLLSILAAGLLGGIWFIGIAILCGLVTLRHVLTWAKTWIHRPVAG